MYLHSTQLSARSVRKQIKIRPGFTPQEDIGRFRGSRQTQMDTNSLPKGHIIGWVPASSTTTVPAPKANLSKAAKKNEKRREKKKEKKDAEKVKDSWEDEEDGDEDTKESESAVQKSNLAASPDTKRPPNSTAADSQADGLADRLEKLEMR